MKYLKFFVCVVVFSSIALNAKANMITSPDLGPANTDPAVGNVDLSRSYSNATVGTSPGETFEFLVSGANSGDDATVRFTNIEVSAITPELSSLALLGTGILGTVGLTRKKFLKP